MVSLSLRVFGLLLWRDLLSFFRDYRGHLFNCLIWITSGVGVHVYLLPEFGLSKDFGTFILASSVASLSFFEVMLNAEFFVADLEGANQISYDLTLPISHAMVFLQRATLFCIRALLLSIVVIPIGKIMFWSRIDLSNFVIWKFILIFLISNIMYGFIGLWLISFIQELEKVVNVWLRIFFPLWFWGGYQFSWQSMFEVSNYLGYVVLANPVIYVIEGTRAAVIGQQGAINFWICLIAASFFCCVFAWRGITLLKRRLDCI